MATSAGSRPELRGQLSKRQMNMIAVGGVIGAGLFVGSGSAIAQAGPAAVVAYAAVGVLVVLVMRMLAELAVASPDTGSFSTYARRNLGAWAGMATGWCYAYLWAVVVGFEAAAGAGILNRLVPDVPAWAAALVFMLVLTGANLIAVRIFGELEFWFAAIKVFAIIGFLLLGVVAIAGLLPGTPAPGTSNLLGDGGFAPHGWLAVGLASLGVVFSYFGTEVVTIAAGEAQNPRDAVRTALRSVVVRILVFYVGAVAVIVTLLPSGASDVTRSPFAAVLDRLGIPAAALLMDIVVLTAVLSCLNSGIYTCSRMLFSLGRAGEGPGALGYVDRRGVPLVAVLVASAGGFLTVLANYFLPTEVIFTFLLESTGAMALVIYLAIAVSQLRGRRRADRARTHLPVRMWGFPHLTHAVIAVLVAVAVALAINPGTQRSFWLTVVVTVVTVVAGLCFQWRRGTSPAVHDGAQEPTATTTPAASPAGEAEPARTTEVRPSRP
jgi:GABA permease